MKAVDYFTQLHQELLKLSYSDIDRLVQVLWKAYIKGQTIFFIGNGGSASTATHLAADIGKNTINNHKDDKEKRFKTQSLTDNSAWIMALGNDLAYEDIFVEQLKNFAKSGDVVVAISGSGSSANVVKAVDWANKSGLVTVGILGFSGGKLKGKVKLAVIAPTYHYGYVEGIHSEIHHFVVEALKELKNFE